MGASCRQLRSMVTVDRHLDVEALGGEPIRQGQTQCRVVFNEQNPTRRGLGLRAWPESGIGSRRGTWWKG